MKHLYAVAIAVLLLFGVTSGLFAVSTDSGAVSQDHGLSEEMPLYDY